MKRLNPIFLLLILAAVSVVGCGSSSAGDDMGTNKPSMPASDAGLTHSTENKSDKASAD